MLLISLANGLQCLFLFHPQGASGQVLERVACVPDVSGDVTGCIDNARGVENRIEQRILR
jgi:hypothetical protein